ncbi:hypothetical protein AB0K16_16085 [Nonomuraea jabiensis]|uniref:hypothetical protein n=1 Tax=Nonomuraea jabiensis TaxID=882448 RepID=UPI0034203DF1
MLVPPQDVTADHAAPLFAGGVVGAVQGEVAQGGELGLDAVETGSVGRRVGEFDVVRRGPAAAAAVLLRGQVRGEVVEHERDADLRRVETAQIAAEFQELGPVLPRLDVAVEFAFAQVVGGEQVSDPVRAERGGILGQIVGLPFSGVASWPMGGRRRVGLGGHQSAHRLVGQRVGCAMAP